MKPHIIKSALANGLTTLVPVGVSVDISGAARRLSAAFSRIAAPSPVAPPTRRRVARRVARRR